MTKPLTVEEIEQYRVKSAGIAGSSELCDIALRALDQQPALERAERWRAATVDQLVVHHIYRAEHDDDPYKAIGELLDWNAVIALDPLVSAEARKLQTDALEKAAKVCDMYAELRNQIYNSSYNDGAYNGVLDCAEKIRALAPEVNAAAGNGGVTGSKTDSQESPAHEHSPQAAPNRGWIATHESGRVFHYSTADGWDVQQVIGAAPDAAEALRLTIVPQEIVRLRNQGCGNDWPKIWNRMLNELCDVYEAYRAITKERSHG